MGLLHWGFLNARGALFAEVPHRRRRRNATAAWPAGSDPQARTAGRLANKQQRRRAQRRHPLDEMNQAQVDHEVLLLQQTIVKLGAPNADGRMAVSFGVLFAETQDVFEALAGTLKAAKKAGVVAYASPLLLKGTHDKVDIVLLVPPP